MCLMIVITFVVVVVPAYTSAHRHEQTFGKLAPQTGDTAQQHVSYPVPIAAVTSAKCGPGPTGLLLHVVHLHVVELCTAQKPQQRRRVRFCAAILQRMSALASEEEAWP